MICFSMMGIILLSVYVCVCVSLSYKVRDKQFLFLKFLWASGVINFEPDHLWGYLLCDILSDDLQETCT